MESPLAPAHGLSIQYMNTRKLKKERKNTQISLAFFQTVINHIAALTEEEEENLKSL